MRILIVDDEPAVRSTLERALRLDGYEVNLAADGAAALEHGRRRSTPIVLDVMMPGVDGLEVCRRLRGAGDRTPILMLTARDAIEDRVPGLDAGADDYLVKPFALDELLARAARAAAPRRRRGRPGELLRYRRPRRCDPGRPRASARGTRRRAHPDRVRAARAVPPATRARCSPATLIFERVWGYDFGPGLQRARGLRQLPAPQDSRPGGEPRLLHTVRGVGYVLRER